MQFKEVDLLNSHMSKKIPDPVKYSVSRYHFDLGPDSSNNTYFQLPFNFQVNIFSDLQSNIAMENKRNLYLVT